MMTRCVSHGIMLSQHEACSLLTRLGTAHEWWCGSRCALQYIYKPVDGVLLAWPEMLSAVGQLAEASVQSAHELRRKRNPRHVLRFPGGPPITAETLQATPLSDLLKANKVSAQVVVRRAKRTFAPVTGANASALVAKYQAATAAASQASTAAHSAADGASSVSWQEIDDTVLGTYSPPL